MPHIHDNYDFVVAIYIVNNDRILLVEHPRYKMWVPPGGHIELDENPEEALYREVAEETGLDVEILSTRPSLKAKGSAYIYMPTPNYMDVHEANPPHKHISLIYFCKAKSDNSVKSAEHTDMKWFTEAELEDPSYQLSEAIKFYSKEALKASGDNS